MVRYSIHNNNIHYDKYDTCNKPFAQIAYADSHNKYVLEHVKQNVTILWSAKLSKQITLYRCTNTNKIILRLMGYIVYLPDILSGLKSVKFMSPEVENPFVDQSVCEREGFSLCLSKTLFCVGFIKDSVMYVAKKLLHEYEEKLIIRYREPPKIIKQLWDISFVLQNY